MERQELLELVSNLNPASQSAIFYGYLRQMNPHDIAYCLSQIKEPGPSYYARLKIAGQETWAKDAAIRLSMSLLDRLPGYKTPKAFIGKDMIRKICQAAIWEHLGNTLCPSCNGKGDFKDGDLLIVCPTCEGFKVVSVSSKRHEAFGMDKEEWKRWNPIYTQALKILDDWQAKILHVMVKNYSGGERVYAYEPA